MNNNTLQNAIEYAKGLGADQFCIDWLKNVANKQECSLEEIEHIIDYLITKKPKLSKKSFAEAKKQAEAWVKTMNKKGMGIEETAEDTEVILDFKDGFKVVKLIGENAYKREGVLMRHCVASYYGRDVEVYSLRDKDNMPHCTMEKDKQIKGKGNGDIHPKYINYVVQFLEHIGMSVGDTEMKHLGYVNVEKLIEDEDIILPELFNGKYMPKNDVDKIRNKDGEKYEDISLWDIFGLLSINVDYSIKFNFNILNSINIFLNKINQKLSVANESYSTAVANDHSSTAVANGISSTAVANGIYSTAVANDLSSTAVANESYSTAVANESYSTAVANGIYSTAVANGISSTAVANGIYSTAVANDHSSTAVANESYSTAVANDHSSTAVANDHSSTAVANGISSTAVANEEKSIAVVSVSYNSKSKAKKGSAIFLCERDYHRNIIHVASFIVDNIKYHEDKFYTLKDGKVQEYSDDLFNS